MRGQAFDRPQGSSNGAEDVREEIAIHLAAGAAELASEGIPGLEAARRAEAEFGNIAETVRYCAALDRETARRARWRDCLTDLATGWRRDVRSLLRRPGTLVAGAGTSALGSAASTALWSVVRQVLIDPLPVPRGNRVVGLGPERLASPGSPPNGREHHQAPAP